MNRSECLARAYALDEAHANAYEDHITALIASGVDALTVDDPVGDRLGRIARASADTLGLTGRCGADAPDVLLWRTVAELPDEALATVTDEASARAALIASLPPGIDPIEEGADSSDWILCNLYLFTTGC